MTSAFDAATEVTAVGPCRYAIDVHPQWSIGGRTNGGYLLATAARAALTELAEDLLPVAVSGAFAAPVPPGPATVAVDVVRRGRSASLIRCTLWADTVPCLEVLVTAARIGGGAPSVPGPPTPAIPAAELCPRLPVQAPGFEVPLMGVVSERLDPATLGFVTGHPSGAGELRGYVEFADGRPMDALGLLLAVDCLPPATFDLPGLSVGWVPTLQLSAFVRAVPVPGPLVVRQLARSVGGGAVDEATDVWDASGRLVAVGHQLAAVRPG